MKAAVFRSVGESLRIEEVPKPEADPGMLVFRVRACGICASDLHAVETPEMLKSGVVPGHEYSGEVVAVGEGVSGWRPGDRMIALPGRPCGECDACNAGNYMQCSQFVLQGFDLKMPGAYAQYSTCMAAMALKLPEAISDTDAATIEPLAVGLNAWREARPETGASVLVVGAGIIGLSIVKWAKFFGAAEVGVSEMVPARQERARQAGADLVIDAGSEPDPVVQFERETGRLPSVIFECVGRPLVNSLIEVAPMGATLVLVGTGMQEERFTVLSAAMKRLRMIFTLGYQPGDFDFILRMLAAGRISVEPLVTGTVTLEQLPAMFDMLGRPNDHCKVLVTPCGAEDASGGA
jgi:(R,R)-butanediol dehydrogenase/meso-butanediol dehydrogenase/diacetyl reductase